MATGIIIRDGPREVADVPDPSITSQRMMIRRGDMDRVTDAAAFAADEDLPIAAHPGTRFYTSASTTGSTAPGPTRA